MDEKPFLITEKTVGLDPILSREIERKGSFPGSGLCELKIRARRAPTTCSGQSCAACGEPGARFDFCQLRWAINGMTLS